MPVPPTPPAALRRSLSQRAWDTLRLAFWRAAASGWLPARWFNRGLPAEAERAARTGRLHVEVVSHCWRYAHLLAYQLSSLVHFPPPRDVELTMTVFYAEEDEATVQLLAQFAAIEVPGVRWHWWALPKEQLFRRAIGRNLAALASRADWVWFTDCDLMFRAGCLGALGAALQGRRDALVYPRVERVTELLADDDPRLRPQLGLVDLDDRQFVAREPGRATGPLQITHGDAARALGYCAPIAYYQQPAEHWCKAHEDRAHRWLLETQGTPIELPGVYRIRHVFKGRYAAGSAVSRLRGWLRRRMG